MSTQLRRGGFLRDVAGQPQAVEDTCEALSSDQQLLKSLVELKRWHSDFVLTGMGSSLAALYPLHLRLLEAGLPAVLIDAGELLHYGGISSKTLLIVVSQSGESIEIVRLLDNLGKGAAVLGITNEPDSRLAKQADVAMLLRAGTEGIVATKTYVASLAAVSILAGTLTEKLDDELKLVRRAIPAMRELLGQKTQIQIRATMTGVFGSRPRSIHLIGRGYSLATAQAGSLILKEGSHTSAEALSGGQFRHGPLEMVALGTNVLFFSPPGKTAIITRRLAEEVVSYGGKAVLVGPHDLRLPGSALPLVETAPLDERVAPLVEIIAVELLTQALAEAKGHEPGKFERMGKVTREE